MNTNPKPNDSGGANIRTLRDEFALAALPAIISKVTDKDLDKLGNKAVMRMVADGSFQMADAMLAAREGK